MFFQIYKILVADNSIMYIRPSDAPSSASVSLKPFGVPARFESAPKVETPIPLGYLVP